MSNICIIPARGGSKRIPRKNIKDFLGLPIIAYSIRIALKSNLFDEVMVSTDDEEIAEVALRFGAQVPFFRSEKNADDFATTMDVVNEVCQSYKNQFQQEFEYVCCVYPTAPLMQIKHLIEGFEKMKKTNSTCVFPVVGFSYPVWRGLELTENNDLNLLWPEFLNSRSQDLKKVYHDAGQWYWFNFKEIQNWEWPENTAAVILSEEEIQDIDTLTDWRLAEIKYSFLHNTET